MNTTATIEAQTYTKAKSNTGTIHLAFEGNAEAACASGKARPLVTPLNEAAQVQTITCKRCVKIAQKVDGERIAAAADTSNIDALLAEATSVQDITAALEAAIAEVEADGDAEGADALRETAPEVIDEATASDTEAADEAAERDAEVEGIIDQIAGTGRDSREVEAELPAAPAAPAAPRQRVNQRDLVLTFLEAHRGTSFTPHAISKAVTPEGMKKLGLRDCLAKMATKGDIELDANAKAASYRLPAIPTPAEADTEAEVQDGE